MINAPGAKRQSAENLKRLKQAFQKATEDFCIDVKIGIRNPGVSLIGLQRLLDFFRAYKGQPEDLLPAPSESDDAYAPPLFKDDEKDLRQCP